MIHVVATGVKILQYWERLLFVGLCRFGATFLAALVTGRMMVVCVGDMYPRLRLLIAAVVATAASFFAIFLSGNPAMLSVPSTVGVFGGIVNFLVVVLAPWWVSESLLGRA